MNHARTVTNESPNYKWKAFLAMSLGTFLCAASASIVNIALPFLGEHFRVDLALLEWVVIAYLIVISSTLLIYGRMGDMYGHKPVYVAGLVIFTFGSLLCGIAGSIETLIGCRLLQGIGAGMVMAIGSAILASSFPPTERGKAMGMIGMVVAMALAAGPVLGGLLVNSFGWRAIFLMNLPVGLLGIFWAAKVLKPGENLKEQRFDFAGSLALFLCLSSFLLALTHGHEWGWASPLVLSLLAGSLIMLTFFIWWELKVPQPLMDLQLLKIRMFSAGVVSAMLSFMASFVTVLLLPFYLNDIAGLEPWMMGLVMTAQPLVIFFVAPVSGNLSDRMGSRLLSSAGMGFTAVALFGLSRIDANFSYLSLMPLLALLGFGSGLFQSPNSSAIMGSVPRNRMGVASSTLASVRNLGMVMGIAIGGAVLQARLPVYEQLFGAAGYEGEMLKSLSFVGAMQDAFFVAGCLALVGIVTSLVRGPATRPVRAKANLEHDKAQR